jgi:hypothetical protein
MIIIFIYVELEKTGLRDDFSMIELNDAGWSFDEIADFRFLFPNLLLLNRIIQLKLWHYQFLSHSRITNAFFSPLHIFCLIFIDKHSILPVWDQCNMHSAC